MARNNSKTRLKGLLMVGFGAMGQAVLPLLLRHFELDASNVKIVKTREDESGIAAEFGVEVIVAKLEH